MDLNSNALRVLPPYRRVAAGLREHIVEGRWNPGDALPSHRALAEEFDVALNTITRAIACLIDEGIVATTERHGTFVNPHLQRTNLGVPGSPDRAAGTHLVPSVTPTRSTGGHIAIITWTQDDPREDSPTPIRDVWSMTVQRQVETSLVAAGRRTRHYRVWSDDHAFSSLEAAIAAAAPSAPSAWIIINVNAHPGWEQILLSSLDPTHVPSVMIAGPPTMSAMPQVGYDQSRAGYLASQHLAKAGYERAIFLRLAEASWLSERLLGAQAGWRDAGRSDATFSIHPPQLAGDYLKVLQGASDEQHTALITAAIDSALKAGDLRADSRSGVIVPTDHAALPLLKLLQARGIVPGRQLGVIGFDDLPASLYAGLSSVRPPLEALGAVAVEQILSGLAGSPLVRQVSLPSEIIARDSTRRDA